MRRAAGPLLALLAAACGGGEPRPGTSPAAVPAWGLPGGRPAPGVEEEARAQSDTVLVFVLDGVGAEELESAAVRLPNLRALAAGAVRYRDATAVSTGGNAGLASLLTGRYPTEHGAGSMGVSPWANLPEAERTLAEGFRARGWRTVASLGEPRHARGLSGFSQGFDGFDAPRPGAPGRDPLGVAIGARDLLAAPLLEPGLPVFGLVVFGAPEDVSRVAPEKLVAAAPMLGERLATVAAERAEVARELQRLEGTTEAARELVRMLGRARGSDAWNLFERAVRDAQLEEVDGAIGRLLDQVEAAGRAESCTVVVCATRGRMRRPSELQVGPRFTEEVLGVPLWIRWARGQGAGDDVPGPTSVLWAARSLDRVFGLDLGPTAFAVEGRAFVSSARLDVHAAVDGERHLERLGLSDAVLAFGRGGGPPAPGPRTGAEPGVDLGEELLRYARRPELAVTWAGDGPAPAVRWETDALRAAAPGGRPGRSGRVALDASAPEVALGLEGRSTAFRVELEALGGGAVGPAAVSVGGDVGSELPLLLLGHEAGGPVQEDAPPALTIEREQGVWWRFRAEGEGPVELLVGCWPPRHPADGLVVELAGGARRTDVPGRPDLAHLVGDAPFDFAVRKQGGESFAVSCRRDGGFLPPERIAVEGRLLGDARGFSFLLPAWQPAASEGMGAVDPSGAPAAGAALSFQRRGATVPAPPEGGLAPEVLEFLRTLPPGE